MRPEWVPLASIKEVQSPFVDLTDAKPFGTRTHVRQSCHNQTQRVKCPT